jgi:hypothetical protein
MVSAYLATERMDMERTLRRRERCRRQRFRNMDSTGESDTTERANMENRINTLINLIDRRSAISFGFTL